MANPQTNIESWRWQGHTNGWTLVIEGKRFAAQEFFDTNSLCQCFRDKSLQSEIIARLRNVVELFLVAGLQTT